MLTFLAVFGTLFGNAFHSFLGGKKQGHSEKIMGCLVGYFGILQKSFFPHVPNSIFLEQKSNVKK